MINILVGIIAVLMLVAVPLNVQAKHDNSTVSIITSEPPISQPQPKQPTCMENGCGKGSSQPSQPGQQFFLCADGTNSTGTDFKGCGPSVTNCTAYSLKSCPSSPSGSSGGSRSKGSGGSISGISVIGIKNSTKSILSCFNASSTNLMNQYTSEQKQIMSENFSTLSQTLAKPSLTNFNGNHTFIQGLQIALSDCFVQLKANETSGTSHTTHHTTTKITGQPKLLSSGNVMPSSSNSTKPTNKHSISYTLGFVRGAEDGKVGIYDPIAACALNSNPAPTNQNDCGSGYNNAYVANCVHGKYGCGDGPSSLK